MNPPKHWFPKDTMLQYIGNITLPYVAKVSDDIGADTTALVIMSKARLHNNSSSAWTTITLSSYGFLPIPQTDQPMDVSVNKPAKEYLRESLMSGEGDGAT